MRWSNVIAMAASRNLRVADAASVDASLTLPVDFYDVTVLDGEGGGARRGFLSSVSSALTLDDGAAVVVWRILVERRLREALAAEGDAGHRVETHISTLRTDPWEFVVGAMAPGGTP